MILSIDGFLRPLFKRLGVNNPKITPGNNLVAYRRHTSFRFLFKNYGNPILKNSYQKFSKRSQELAWFEGKKIADLPQYLYWPEEGRYGKVLWWGYGNDGLYLIEKGLGYKYADTKSNFLPAEENEYLDYLNS